MTLALRILSVLPSDQRRKAYLLVIALMASSLLEVVGIASLLPFLDALASSGVPEPGSNLAWLYDTIGFTSSQSFIIALGAGSLFVVLVSAGVRSGTLIFQNSYLQHQRHKLSCRLFEGYINQPFEFFLGRTPSDLAKNILAEVDIFVERALAPLTQVISYGFVLAAVSGLLLVLNPIAAITVVAVLLVIYWVISRIVRQKLARGGQERVEASQLRFRAANDAFQGIKAVKVRSLESFCVDNFSVPSLVMSRSIAGGNIVGQLPRYVVEAVAFGALIFTGLTITLITEEEDLLAAVLPILALYAFAGYRALPAFQNVYLGVTSLRYARPTVDALAEEIERFCRVEREAQSPTDEAAVPRMKKSLALKGVYYNYPSSTNPSLCDINLLISKGEVVGIVGSSGAGKTTLIDVIIGLLVPSSGRIFVDEVELTGQKLRSWRSRIGYVPQDIYLSTGTITSNIALGVPSSLIDVDRVVECARLARIDSFIKQLSLGYDTQLSSGIQMSGGQRQRIGIARALYDNPDLLILDEATSALDNATEREVMDAVDAIARQKTMIIVAHRLTTLRTCDRILVLERGNLVAAGAWDDLAATCEPFIRLIAGHSAPVDHVDAPTEGTPFREAGRSDGDSIEDESKIAVTVGGDSGKPL